MNYIWEAALAADTAGIRREELRFLPVRNGSPYTEVVLEHINSSGLERPEVEVNPLYRFATEFSAVFDLNLKYIVQLDLRPLVCALSIYCLCYSLGRKKANAQCSDYYYVIDGYSIYAAVGIDDWNQPEYVASNQLLKESRFNESKIQLETILKRKDLTAEQEAIVANNLGIAYACLGYYKQSELLLKKELLKDDQWDIAMYNTLVAVYGNLGKQEMASKYSELLPDTETAENSELKLAIKNNKILFLEEETEDARRALMEESKQLGRRGLVSTINCLNMADILINSKSGFLEANRFVQKADFMNKKNLDNPMIHIRICEIRAQTCAQFGSFDNGIKEIDKAVSMLKTFGIENSKLAAEIYMNSGRIQANLKSYTLAMEENQKALAIYNPDSIEAGISCINISNIYLMQSKMDETIEWRIRAYNIFHDLEESKLKESRKNQVVQDLFYLFKREGHDRRGSSFEEWLGNRSYELLEDISIQYDNYFYITDGYGIYMIISLNNWNEVEYEKSNILLKESRFNEAIIQLEDLLKLEGVSDEKKSIIANNLGVAYACSGNYLEAESLLKKAKLNCHGWDDAFNNNLGNVYGYFDDDPKTYDDYEPLLDDRNIRKNELGVIVRSNELQFLSENMFRESKHLIEREKELLGRNELVGILNHLYMVESIFLFRDGYPGLYENLDQAASINNRLNNPLLHIRICEMKAFAYQLSEKYTEGEQQIREALNMLESRGLENCAIAGEIYVRSVYIQKELGNYTLAFKENQRALEFYKSNAQRIEWIYSNISSISELQGSIDESVTWRLKAYKTFKDLDGQKMKIHGKIKQRRICIQCMNKRVMPINMVLVSKTG